MSGITGMGTTFNLPNYHGELFGLSPTDTPLLSMAGGIGGGRQTTSTLFDWQTYDLRDPVGRPRLEGADAPTAEARVRGEVRNIVQIFQEAVTTSYTKQAATGQFQTPGSAPFFQSDGLGGDGAIGNEHTWQVQQALKQIARDVNYVFWNSKQVIPTDNTTARQTAGLLSVISTNKTFNLASVTASSATDTITAASHGMSNGDQIVFVDIDAATNVRVDRTYYVVSAASGTFKVAATSGGSAITLGTAAPTYVTVSGSLASGKGVSVDLVNSLIQGIYDQGGMMQGETRTLFVPSIQKTRITKAYATAYSSTVSGIGMSTGHTVGGVAVDRIMTDFGECNLVVDRALPKDAIAAVSMDMVDPVFLSIPNKGVLFEEQLAKTGAADKSQIYGEIGLAYGAEHCHGVLRGLAVA